MLFSRRGFTLIEILVASVVFALVAVTAVEALASLWLSRNQSLDRSDLVTDLYAATETIAETIKQGGIIDYEGYFERTVRSASRTGANLFSGTTLPTIGFGNYWSGGAIGTNTYGDRFYTCASQTWANILWNEGCWTANSAGVFLNSYGQTLSGSFQRYGQYQLQFRDTNGDRDNDRSECALTEGADNWRPWWDENCDGNPLRDVDDIEIGRGPNVLSGTGAYRKELMLVRNVGAGLERQILRWKIEQDPDAPSGAVCALTSLTATATGCVGRLEYLRLIGLDMSSDHDGFWSGAFDSIVDTWVCPDEFPCNGPAVTIAGRTYRMPSGADSEWVDVLPSDISVQSIDFLLPDLPDSSPRYAWATASSDIGAPYVRIIGQLGFAQKKRKRISGVNPSVPIYTTIHLSQ